MIMDKFKNELKQFCRKWETDEKSVTELLALMQNRNRIRAVCSDVN